MSCHAGAPIHFNSYRGEASGGGMSSIFDVNMCLVGVAGYFIKENGNA